jgi:hypothetical protein
MLPVLVSLLICLRDWLIRALRSRQRCLPCVSNLSSLQRRNQKQRMRLSIADRLFWVHPRSSFDLTFK